MLHALQSVNTLHGLKTHDGHRVPLSKRKSIMAAELFPPLQTLLQVLDAIQPATKWTIDERPNTATCTPMDMNYNPFRIQSITSALYLTYPDNLATTTKYLIRPPRFRSDLRRDAYWAPW